MTMFFELDDAHRHLQDAIRGFLVRSLPQQGLVERLTVPQRDVNDDQFYRPLCEEMGLLAGVVPESRGGAGGGLMMAFIMFREFGRALYGGAFLPSLLAAIALAHAEGGDDDRALLARLLTGEFRAAVTGLGLDAGRRLLACRSGEQWVLDGDAGLVVGAVGADLLVAFAECGDGLGCFVIDTPGAVASRPAQLLDHSRSGAWLSFERQPARLIAGPHAAASSRGRTAAFAAICMAAEQVGVAEMALEIAVDHAKLREQFGAPIGSFQAIKHRCSDMAVAVEAAGATAQFAAWGSDGGVEAGWPLASIAKSVCSEAAIKATTGTIQILGGIGFTWEHPIHFYYRRGLCARQMFGSTRDHRTRVAMRLFDDEEE